MSPAEDVIAGPLATMLDRISETGAGVEGIDLSARPGVPDEPGWVTVAGLAGDRALIEDLMARIERGCGAYNRAYSGTTLLRGNLWRALTPAVAAMLTERRLPDLRAENVALRFGEGGFAEDLAFLGPRFAVLADDSEAGHPDAVVLPSEEAMLDLLYDTLAQTHLPAMISALRGLRVRRGTRVLWRAAGDVCAEAFMYVGQWIGLEEQALGFGEKLLSGPSLLGPTNYYLFEHVGGSELTRVRNTCCLYYKLGDDACFTCPRTTHEERLRRMADGL
jgi:ferric iron reductase protein FhuF